MIYPQPFGIMTAASEKDYPVDFSHFNIMGSAVRRLRRASRQRARGVHRRGPGDHHRRHEPVKLKLPIVVPGLGSTYVAKRNWDGLAIGVAISGCMLTIGENVCGMDDDSIIENGRIMKSPDMETPHQDVPRLAAGRLRRHRGAVQRGGHQPRACRSTCLTKLGVETVELKWGQGAKDIGGEVKLKSIEKARSMKQKGYIVLPGPDDPET